MSIEGVRPELIEGLKAIHPDELTPEEQMLLDHADEVEAEKAVEAQEASLETLAEQMATLPDAPSLSDLEGWKSQYGTIHMSTINGDDIYLWRLLKRSEYKQMMRAGSLGEEIRAEDYIVRKVLLYPRPNDRFMNSTGAGVVSTLKEQIMFNSGFISREAAIRMVKII